MKREIFAISAATVMTGAGLVAGAAASAAPAAPAAVDAAATATHGGGHSVTVRHWRPGRWCYYHHGGWRPWGSSGYRYCYWNRPGHGWAYYRPHGGWSHWHHHGRPWWFDNDWDNNHDNNWDNNDDWDNHHDNNWDNNDDWDNNDWDDNDDRMKRPATASR
ncbi:MAG TPA: hypothetical protein VFY17_11080 [Pilimelia sp.]|nr:hypothetical protein [Pilimelia sp.]